MRNEKKTIKINNILKNRKNNSCVKGSVSSIRHWESDDADESPKDSPRCASSSLLVHSRIDRIVLYENVGFSSSGGKSRLIDVELTMAIGFRLGLPVAAPAPACFFGERVDALCNHEIQSIRRHDEVNLRLCEYEYCDCDMLTGAESPAVLKHSACGTRFSTFWCHDFRASSDFYQWHGDGTQLSNTWAVCRHQP